ncbi:O-methylsterigmatocystin oxidoreductase [Trametes cingulata]|nr:O-methylsterigmatocystin oxidoreductase [Trametes cingulata]
MSKHTIQGGVSHRSLRTPSAIHCSVATHSWSAGRPDSSRSPQGSSTPLQKGYAMISYSSLSTLFFFVSLIAAACLLRRHKSRSSRPLPPGPTPLPIVGNLLDMPTKRLGPAFRDMAKKYGDVVYLDILGQPMIILNSYEAAVAILDGRSANTSDRPPSLMAELSGYSWQFVLQGYTLAWRQRRKDFHGAFHPNAIIQFQPIHLRECRRFLQRLLVTPENFAPLARHVFSATIMDAVYGIRVAEQADPFVSLSEKVATTFSTIVVPGRYLVEVVPWLRYLPAWFPGAKFKRDALSWRSDVAAARDLSYDVSVEAMTQGMSRSSIVAALVEKTVQKEGHVSQEDTERFRDVTGLAYLTGADTTLFSMQAFFLAMVQYPEAQKKAQEELDRVIGPERLPDFSDRDSLPYVNAVVKEIIRWHSVVPLGVSHRAIDEDEYKGYRIPAGSVIVPNAWAMSQDPVAYPEPEKFIPERFFKDGKVHVGSDCRDPEKFQFGFGRRICPGRHFANDSLFLTVASVLHVFDIRPPLGGDGKQARVAPRIVTDYFLSYPEPFQCRITPRSARAETLIKTAGQTESE